MRDWVEPLKAAGSVFLILAVIGVAWRVVFAWSPLVAAGMGGFLVGLAWVIERIAKRKRDGR